MVTHTAVGSDVQHNVTVLKEHAYGLAPMQAGMLFQALLSEAGNTGGYDIEQLHFILKERLNHESFKQAWTIVARRHSILSTSFRWEGVEEPEQSVHRGVAVPVEFQDWTNRNETERTERLTEFLKADRLRGFDLREPPLMRVTVFATGLESAEVVWTFHHILLDGRSFAPVLSEVFAAYDALVEAKPLALLPPPRAYRDFIHWLGNLDRQASRGFFKELLKGKSTPTPLPCAEPAGRPLPETGFGEVHHVVSRDVSSRFADFAKLTGSTVGTLVNAAWALVLARFSTDEDVVFGSTRACRRSALDGAAESMIGCFINTLPIRGRLPDDRSVRELLADLRVQSVAMRDHEHTPLVDVHAASEVTGGTALFETLVMFENQELARTLRATGVPRFQDCKPTLYEQPSVPVTVTVFDGDVFELRILFERRRFKQSVVERLAASLEVALDELTRDPDRKLGALDVIPRAERERIVFEWNDTPRPFPENTCIHEPFEAMALTQPDARAVEMDGVSITYRELEERSNRLAHALRARGARPSVYVGICLSRGIDLVVALMGVAKSGAAYVPLDPQYPQDRLEFMLSDAQAIVVVTEQRHAPLFGAQLLVLDGEGAHELAAQSNERLSRLSAPTDVCYAIFTSGSTGIPKGVVLSHRAVVNTFDWVTRTFGLVPGDRLLFVTSPCFDLSVYDTFGALGAGATVVVASEQRLKDPETLARAIVEQGITVWDSAPAALQRLTSFFPKRGTETQLRLVMLSGDWIPLTLPDAVRSSFPNARVMSLGGATEAAIWSNWYPIGAIDPRWNSVPYGRPIQNSWYHVLDRRMQPVPIGVPGDLYIGGACLADGYLNRVELTAERFVSDPFRPGQRLYKTGDLARYFEDGELEFLGRADFQVKIRGFRVEMGEVEAAIMALPGVREAVCAAYSDASGVKSLAAYVVAKDGEKLEEEAIKSALARKLPDFMVPSQVLLLAAMPISSNGKLDRKALPNPTARTSADTYVAPTSPLESQMVEVWEELLQRKPIGIRDDFFKLGGHSLLAVMLVSRAKAQLGIELPLSRVLEHPTVESLVDSLEAPMSARARRKHLVVLNGKGSRPPLFLLPGAGGYSFVYQNLPTLLGPEQPVFALQAIGAEGDGDVVDHSIEEMAAIYEPEILDVCPDGPLVLAGYSFGVLVAYEVLRRLRARGRDVQMLISLDGYAPGFPTLLPWPERALAHLNELVHGDKKRRKAYIAARFQNVRKRVLQRLGREDHEAADIPFADPELSERLGKLWASLWRARLRYSPTGAEPVKLLLIKSSIPERWVGNKMDCPLYGWDSYVTGTIATVSVPGEHLSLFEAGTQRLIADAIAMHTGLRSSRES